MLPGAISRMPLVSAERHRRQRQIGSHDEGHERLELGCLSHREVGERRELFAQLRVLRIAHDADHAIVRLRAARHGVDLKRTADRPRVAKELRREQLVDDRHLRSARSVFRSERPPRDHRRLHRREIFGSDAIEVGDALLLLAVDEDVLVPSGPAQGNDVRLRRAHDARGSRTRSAIWVYSEMRVSTSSLTVIDAGRRRPR